LRVSRRSLWRYYPTLAHCFLVIPLEHILPCGLYSRSPLPHPACFSLLARCSFPLTISLQSPDYLWFRVIHLPWRWRRYVFAKRRFKPDPHGATSQETIFFSIKLFECFTHFVPSTSLCRKQQSVSYYREAVSCVKYTDTNLTTPMSLCSFQ
jgi:hypothetical protein